MTIVGNLTVTEGDNITLYCDHQPGFPASNGSLFFIDDVTAYVEQVKGCLSKLRVYY